MELLATCVSISSKPSLNGGKGGGHYGFTCCALLTVAGEEQIQMAEAGSL